MKLRIIAKMIMTALKMSSAGQKLHAISTLRQLPRQTPWWKFRQGNQNRIQWGGELSEVILFLQSRVLFFTKFAFIPYTPFTSPTGDTVAAAGAGNKQPTRKPAPGRSVVPTTSFPTYSPTITVKPSEYDACLI